ncbi:MAG: hypothetical protein IKO65_01810 [Victivallales bacterium]|nr:hypothetical protein [Victivallales bacterium]
MSKLYAIYAQKHKMDRMDPLKCLELARLLRRQEVESGGHVRLVGLMVAAKEFRCEETEDGTGSFVVSPGEYCLVCLGGLCNLNLWRLRRHVRSRAEEKLSWAFQIGFPVKSETASSLDGALEKTAFPLPYYEDECLAAKDAGEDFLMVYVIHEAFTWGNREDTGNYTKYTPAELFPDDVEMQKAMRIFLQCRSGAELRAVPGYAKILQAVVLAEEQKKHTGEAHLSLVLAVINGQNHHWRCGVWCYSASKDDNFDAHPVNFFYPKGYCFSNAVCGWKPYF